MNYETIRYIIIGAVVLGVTIFILKSFVKAALIALVVVFLFRVGWVYTGADIENSMFLNKILHPEFIEQVVEGYNNFANKRTELGEMIDPESLEDAVREELKDKVNQYLNGTTKEESSEEDIDEGETDDTEETDND